MNKIEYGMKLDFGNVLIRPKRTTISSRSEVDLERNFNFNSKNNWKGTPVIAANMDTIGTFEIYDKLKEFKIMTALHKHYDLDDFLNLDNIPHQLLGDFVKTELLLFHFHNVFAF